MRRLRDYVTCGLGVAIWCLSGRAENVSWTNSVSGVFSNPRNWIAGPQSMNRVPTGSDDVSFLEGGIVVTVDGAQATHELLLDVPLTLAIQGTYSVAELFAQTGVEISGGGELSIGRATSLGGCTFSGLTTTIGFIDLPSGSLSSPSADPFRITGGAKLISEDGKTAGHVIVDNSGEWEHLGDLYDTLTGGAHVPGALPQISSGGVVRFHQVEFAQAEVEAGGRFESGESGIVYLRVRDGGVAKSDSAAMSFGMATIEGSGSGWTVGSKFRAENAFLTVTNGALFSAQNAELGLGSMSQVGGGNSRLAVGTSLNVTSPLQVWNGGAVSATEILLGELAGRFGSLLVSGSGSTAVATKRLFVGDGGTGSLNVLDGGRAEAQGMLLGIAPGSLGSILVRDPASTFVVTGPFGIGEEGSGNLMVERGARFQVSATGLIRLGGLATGDGTLRVSDANTTFDARGLNVQVGAAGKGTLQVQEGARFLSAAVDAGKEPGSSGTVQITALSSPVSLELSQDLTVGLEGAGQLTINAASGGDAQLVARSLVLSGGHGEGAAEISGTRANAHLGADLLVGVGTKGTLRVGEGARMLVDRNFGVGLRTGSSGTVNLEGAGSSIEVSTQGGGLIVGVEGTGDVHLRRGASLKVPLAEIGHSIGGVIDVQDAGSVLTIDDTLFVAGRENGRSFGTLAVSAGGRAQIGTLLCVHENGILQLLDGSVNIGAPQIPPPGVIRISQGGTLGGNSVISGVHVLVGDGGRLTPGCSIGKLTIQGSLECQEGSTVEMEIAGPVAGREHDVLEVSGETKLGGMLILKFMDGFAPVSEQIFDLVKLGTNTVSDFQQVLVQGLAPGFEPILTRSGDILRLQAGNDGVATSAPRLTISSAGPLIGITWPASSQGFTLQSTTNLANSSWEPVTTVNNGTTLPASSGMKFFRLFR